jgi:hypothetical protein
VTNDETQRAIADARGALARVRGEDMAPAPRRRRRRGGAAQRLILIGAVNSAILLLAGIFGLAVAPIGMFGALLVMILMAAVTLAIAFAPATRPVAFEALKTSDVRALPAQTGRWLEAQRPALPPPARGLIDQIGIRLDALAPQLATLDPAQPAADEVRKLVGEQLPEFVRDYQAVPASLRTTPRNGKTPDAQLVDGLKLIDGQIAELSTHLAQGDLDALATRGRFLEIKYRGDGAD